MGPFFFPLRATSAEPIQTARSDGSSLGLQGRSSCDRGIRIGPRVRGPHAETHLHLSSPCRRALPGGAFAEFERAINDQELRAGLKRAKDEGKRLGRFPDSAELEPRSLPP